jgi:hypothetical protein
MPLDVAAWRGPGQSPSVAIQPSGRPRLIRREAGRQRSYLKRTFRKPRSEDSRGNFEGGPAPPGGTAFTRTSKGPYYPAIPCILVSRALR